MTLKTLFRAHAEWLLTAAGLALVVTTGWFLVWGVTTLAAQLGASLSNPRAPYAGEKFDLEKASALNLRGL